MTEHSRHCDER